MRNGLTWVLLLFLLVWGLAAGAEEKKFKFALPEFDTAYARPETVQPPARGIAWPYIDAGLLAAVLALAAWAVLKRRSRPAIYSLMFFSVLYFGFWKKGCICPVGSLQNVTAALFDPLYAVPLVLLAVFLLPLVFTLFFGRVFCGAVCPLGVIQDLVVIKPIRVRGWIEHTLGMGAYLYLGLAILLAATGAGYVICRFDPFVTLFRLSGSLLSVALCIAFFGIGTVVARPYCRYLCPYGALMRLVSLFSRSHVSVTPDECVKCRLCENACPFGAINPPAPARLPELRPTGLRRLAVLLVVLPVFLLAGTGAGWLMHTPLLRMHRTAALAEAVYLEDTGQRVETTLETDAFRAVGGTVEELAEQASAVDRRFLVWSLVFGLSMGLAVWVKMVSLARYPSGERYEPDRMKCLSCARCFSACPREHLRRKAQVSGRR